MGRQQVLNSEVDEHGAVIAVQHPVVAHPCTDLTCGGRPAGGNAASTFVSPGQRKYDDSREKKKS